MATSFGAHPSRFISVDTEIRRPGGETRLGVVPGPRFTRLPPGVAKGSDTFPPTAHEPIDWERKRNAVEELMIAYADNTADPVLADCVRRVGGNVLRGRADAADLIELLVQAHLANNGSERLKEPQPEVPWQKMPRPRPATDEEREVMALIRSAVAMSRTPTQRMGTKKDYRCELEAQALCQFYAPRGNVLPGTLEETAKRAVEAAKKQLETLHDSLGTAENGQIVIKVKKVRSKT